jgi:hypothetical protein
MLVPVELQHTMVSALLASTLLSVTGLAGATISLEDAIREAVLPLLQNQSSEYENSAWGFSYVDATTRVSFCAGYSDRVTLTNCTANDMHAWGSTTKVMTATRILQLHEMGKLKLDDSIVLHANEYVKHLSRGATSLVSLFGPQIHNVTIRHLLQMVSGIWEYDNKELRQIQNFNRSIDLDPLWILNYTNRTFMCDPGTCGSYSSTNYVILGLVIANYAPRGMEGWDKVDQRDWIPESYQTSYPNSSFNDIYYPVHGACSNFTSARPGRENSTMHGFQQDKFIKKGIVPDEDALDVISMSCLQGWTCGNLVAPTISIADFFWTLLGPPSLDPSTRLLRPDTLEEMLSFRNGTYLGEANPFGYGLGMMNFTSMNWGFEYEGLLYGHNGLTYGFGAQSGYHLDLEFAVTWNNNAEHWIGPDYKVGPYPMYTALVEVVRKYRAENKKQANMVMI